jgi:hypothetical protein
MPMSAWFREKNGRATSGDRGWGADGSSSPAFAWGQALVSGEEIVSATIAEAKLVPRKNRDKSYG